MVATRCASFPASPIAWSCSVRCCGRLIELHWARDRRAVDRRVHGGRSAPSAPVRVRAGGLSPSAVKAGLVEMQEGRCFYCGQPTRFEGRGRPLPRLVAMAERRDREPRRSPIDCNGAKSDHLVDGTHLRHWLEHVRSGIGTIWSSWRRSRRWMSDAARSEGLVRSTYSHVARGTPLWVTGREFIEADGPLLPT